MKRVALAVFCLVFFSGAVEAGIIRFAAKGTKAVSKASAKASVKAAKAAGKSIYKIVW